MSDRRDGAPQQQVDRLHVEDSCRTARSSPTCPSLQSLVNALFHLAAWIAPGDYAPGAVTGAVVSIPATGYFFAWVRRQARATAAELILAVAVGTVVAAVAIGFLSCLTAAPVSVRTALKPRGSSPTRQSHRTPGPWVVGTGAAGRMQPDPDTIQQLQDRGVTVETLPTSQAVRRFGELDPANTAAALHLTC